MPSGIIEKNEQKNEEKHPYDITLLGCLHKVEIMIEELGNYEKRGESSVRIKLSGTRIQGSKLYH